MIKGVIFDLDGVLCFTDRYHYKAWQQVVQSLGIDLTENLYNKLRGLSREDTLTMILQLTGKELSDYEKSVLCEIKNNLYISMLQEFNSADTAADVVPTLQQLRQRGIKIAVGSSSKNARYILERLNLVGEFDAIADGTVVTCSKPDPEVFLLAADMLHLAPQECIVVEDGESGIDAANKGGFVSVGIGYAATCEQTAHPIARISEVLRFLD